MASQKPIPKLFPPLSERLEGLSPDGAAKHQRARLEGAMVAAVAQHGYEETTVGELVALAGVSKSTFYNHFDGKRECFLATFDDIVDQLAEAVAAAFAEAGELREKLSGALTAFMRLAVDHPAAASLLAVDALTLGAAGVNHRERASERFEQMMEIGLAGTEGAAAMPAQTIRTVVSGLRGVAYWRLRAGEERELPELVDPLVDWALGYLRPHGELTERAVAAAAAPAPPPPPPPEDLPDWEEPPDSRLSRRALTQQQRIVRAAARVVVESGYDGLTIPRISAVAGVSNQTFYKYFDSKRDAFLAAFDELAAQRAVVTAAAIAGAGDRVEALGIGIRALLESIAADEAFAKIGFFELPMAGAVALDRGDAALDAFTAFISPERMPSEYSRELPAAVREAIGGGIWGVIQHELHNGRRAELPQLAPEITRLALAPLDPA